MKKRLLALLLIGTMALPLSACKKEEEVATTTSSSEEEVEEEVGTFKDVPPDSEYYEAVEAIYASGIIELGDGYFRPEDETTRSDVAAMIYNIVDHDPPAEEPVEGEEPTDTGFIGNGLTLSATAEDAPAEGEAPAEEVSVFQDVAVDDPLYEIINWFTEATGFYSVEAVEQEDGTMQLFFHGDDPITKADLAKILWIFSARFEALAEDDPGRSVVEALTNLAEGEDPQATILRGEIAQKLYEFTGIYTAGEQQLINPVPEEEAAEGEEPTEEAKAASTARDVANNVRNGGEARPSNSGGGGGEAPAPAPSGGGGGEPAPAPAPAVPSAGEIASVANSDYAAMSAAASSAGYSAGGKSMSPYTAAVWVMNVSVNAPAMQCQHSFYGATYSASVSGVVIPGAYGGITSSYTVTVTNNIDGSTAVSTLASSGSEAGAVLQRFPN